MKKRIVFFTIFLTMSFCIAGCAAEKEQGDTPTESGQISSELGEQINSEINDQTSSDINSESLAPANDNVKSDGSVVDLNAEILAIEDSILEIDNQIQDALTQGEMNELSAKEYQLWDDELNSLWERFSENASDSLKATVLEEQREWIKSKEEKVAFAGAENEGGSMQPLIENSKAAELTRIRCYELAGYLAKTIGQKFDLEVPKFETQEYVDRQGTSDIYSELTIEETSGSEYNVSISLYRLAALEGKAVMKDSWTYVFEDQTLGVKGIIRVLDAYSNATFEVTQSDWENIKVGDTFEFPETK